MDKEQISAVKRPPLVLQLEDMVSVVVMQVQLRLPHFPLATTPAYRLRRRELLPKGPPSSCPGTCRPGPLLWSSHPHPMASL